MKWNWCMKTDVYEFNEASYMYIILTLCIFFHSHITNVVFPYISDKNDVVILLMTLSFYFCIQHVIPWDANSSHYWCMMINASLQGSFYMCVNKQEKSLYIYFHDVNYVTQNISDCILFKVLILYMLCNIITIGLNSMTGTAI